MQWNLGAMSARWRSSSAASVLAALPPLPVGFNGSGLMEEPPTERYVRDGSDAMVLEGMSQLLHLGEALLGQFDLG